jgi:hypothetical protein
VVVAGFSPAAAAARPATEGLGLEYVYVSYQPTILPSPHHAPPAYANGPLPPGVVDNRVLWQLDGRHMQELFGATLNGHRAAIGLSPLDNLRDYALTDCPWLATDPILDPWQPADRRSMWASAACRCAPRGTSRERPSRRFARWAFARWFPRGPISPAGRPGCANSASAPPMTVPLPPPSRCLPRSKRPRPTKSAPRATSVAATIRTDGASVAATLLTALTR